MLAHTLMALATAASIDSTSLAANFDDLPNLKRWLSVWSAPNVQLTSSLFQFELSRELKEAGIWVVADSGVTYASFPPTEARRWVLSPDSSYAVAFLPPVDEGGYPILEPDSQVQLCEFASGRQRVILQCGTPCDFEVAEWLDTKTVLVGGGNWEDLKPWIYRVNVSEGNVLLYAGPTLPESARETTRERVRKFWSDSFPWIRW